MVEDVDREARVVARAAAEAGGWAVRCEPARPETVSVPSAGMWNPTSGGFPASSGPARSAGRP